MRQLASEADIKALQLIIQQKENHYDLALENNLAFDELKKLYFDIKALKNNLKMLLIHQKKTNHLKIV